MEGAIQAAVLTGTSLWDPDWHLECTPPVRDTDSVRIYKEVQMKQSLSRIVLVASLLAITSVLALARQNDSVTGKEGWVTINRDTMFGDVVLKPGFYLVTDETSGTSHRVSFHKAGDPNLALQYSDKAFEGDPVIRNCSIQAATGIFKKTKIVTVSDGSIQHLTQLQIKGEDVIHVF